MVRKPEVFVRNLNPAEMQRLVKITRTASDRIRLRRAGIVLASVQGRSAGRGGGDVRRHGAVPAGSDRRVQRAGVRGVVPKVERGPAS